MGTGQLTAEQIDRLMCYGQCWICGAPRDLALTVDDHLVTRGSVTMEMAVAYRMNVSQFMVCENGHIG